ncbi:hypothetical protein FLONG3_9216 [Fusarium longipes]|uniref:Ubiquitin-like protease family profile domain-containing protein n=1 Tax=Fusarium longipes TaxID=694270 RepID=A0A395RZG2_9HYPO|nr:hypothetical protein FLONG3_9216 [Fusarium longipes]
MTNLRMRAINDQKPRSSMSIGQSTKTSRSDVSRDERPNKRIKKSGSELPCASASRYITNSRPSPLEAIEDEPETSAKPFWHHDLPREGSYAETVGGSSVTGDDLAAAAGSGVPEYRNVQRRNTIKRSRRRRKTPRKVTSSPGEVDDDTSAVAHRNLPPQHSPALTSPDCLSMNIHQDGGPPPVDITSDVLSQSKRSASEYAQSAAKRYMLHKIGSEDELSKPGTSAGRETPKKSTGKLVSQSPSRAQRGDIRPTSFGSVMTTPMGRRNLTRTERKEDELVLTAAICGKHMFVAENTEDFIKLHLDSGLARPLHRSGQGLPWLELSKQSIHRVRHSNSRSPIVVIHRSIHGHFSGNLTLRFYDIAQASLFIAWLHGIQNLEEIEPAKLENMLTRAMEEINGFEHKSKRSPGPISPSTFTASTPRPLSRSSHRDPFQGEPISPRRTKLKDRMQGLPLVQEEVKVKPEDVEDSFEELVRKPKPETRQTRRSPPEPHRETSPITWTAQNPGWDKDWHRSLVYPPTGKNRATVDKEDIFRLDEGEFLNDNLISFYLRYLQVQLEKERPEILEKVYIFNTFFFEKLRSNRAKINYDGVKAWTARVDLLSYDYIVVPVNENAHWYLAIIYNAPCLLPKEVKAEASKNDESSNLQGAIIIEDNNPAVDPAEKASYKKAPPGVSLDLEAARSTRNQAVPGDGVVLLDDETVTNSEALTKPNKRKSTGGNQKYSTDEPRIITLDSLGAAHTPTCKCLRDYLVEEAKDKKGVNITERPGGMTARGIPEQDNYCDCGVYVLGYMENFLKDPDEAVRRLLHKEDSQWIVKPQQIRAKVRDLLFKFQKEQHLRLEKEKELKRRRRATKGPVSSPQVAPSSPQVPQKDPETPHAKRDLKSAIPCGTIRAESEEPCQTGTTSAYFVVGPPEKPVQPQTPTRNDDLSFVKPLRDSSSNGAKSSSSEEVFHSARSSPITTAQQIIHALTTESHAPYSERKGPNQPLTPRFVQELSESPDEVDLASISSTVKRNSSPSVTLATRQKVSSSEAQGSQSVFDEKPSIMKSIEKDRPSSKGPQYDGVERTIDLTG